jgi:hypothetical protein
MGNSAWSGSYARTLIQDTDGDTRVETEKNPDEDIVRVTAGGVEGGKFYSSGIVDFALQSAARAYLAGAQSIGTAAWTKVLLDTENYDVQNEFASNKFTVTVSGKYLLVASLGIIDIVANVPLLIAIYVNGSGVCVNKDVQPISDTSYVAIVDIQTLTATDYVELYVFQAHGTNRNMITGSVSTFLAVSKIA